ncbi:MAG: hypothetical protein IKX58_05055 [Clostridia bacterium]|nr:hypothetical protein [Clostridia bacterium]
MKKVFLVSISFVFILLGFCNISGVAYAEENGFVRRENNQAITFKEKEVMREELEARNYYGSGLTIEPLYDKNDEPTFLLGVTELGYAIMRREDYIVFECGEANPFCGYESCKKYYGGILSYYVKEADRSDYRNIMTGDNEPMTLPYISENTRDWTPPDPYDINKRLENERYITQYAFGYNDKGTCNVIGFAIALNYLRMQYQYPVFTTDTTPELFKYINPFPKKYENVKKHFPKAEELHQRVLKHFYTPILAWGKTYCDNANHYLESVISKPSRRPTVYYKFKPSFIRIYDEIVANRPMIASTWNAPVFSNHTMAVYGLHHIATPTSETTELLVHTGWYVEDYYERIGNKYQHIDTYVNCNAITYVYFFNLP